MKNRFLIIAMTSALLTFACAKTETTNTDTGTTDTGISTTDTTGTDTTGTGATGGTASTLSNEEKDFVMKTAQGGMAEVAAGQMASTKAANADVKAFGNRMVADHGKSNDELKQLATNKGLALPAETDEQHKQKADELSKKTGKAFDKAYMAAMVDDHTKTVADFEKMSQSATDPDIKSWTTATLPTLRDHLKMAQDLAAKVK